MEKGEKSGTVVEPLVASGGKNNFLDVLHSESRLEAFKLFLRRSHCSESLTFYMDVQRYRKVNDDTERAHLADGIYRTYFGDDTNDTCAVNVSAACARRVREALRQNSVKNTDTTVFDEAQLEVFQMLRFDLLPRFLRQECHHQLGSVELGSADEQLDYSNAENKRNDCSPIATAQPRRSILRLLRDALAVGGVPSLLGGGSNLLSTPASANRSASLPHEAEASVPTPSMRKRQQPPRTRASAEHASTIAAAMAMMNGCRNFGGATAVLRHSYSFTQCSMEADDDASFLCAPPSTSTSLVDNDDAPPTSLKSGNSFYGSSVEKSVVAVQEDNDIGERRGQASRLRHDRDKVTASAADEKNVDGGGEVQRSVALSSADEADDFGPREKSSSGGPLSLKKIAVILPLTTTGGCRKATASMGDHCNIKYRNNDDDGSCKYDYNDAEHRDVERSARQPLSSLLPSPLLTRRSGPQTSRSRFSEAALLGHQRRHTATTAADSLTMMKMAIALRHRQQQQKHQQQ